MTASYIPALFSKILFLNLLTANFFDFFSICIYSKFLLEWPAASLRYWQYFYCTIAVILFSIQNVNKSVNVNLMGMSFNVFKSILR